MAKFKVEKINNYLEKIGEVFSEELGKMQDITKYIEVPSTFFDVEIDEEKERIVVNGKYMKLVYGYGWTYKWQKTRIKTNSIRDLGDFMQSDYANCLSVDICEHVLKYGK